MSHKPRILIYDIGGCEGCAVSVMRSYDKLAKAYEVHVTYLGNVDLDKTYDYAIVSGAVKINDERRVEELKRIRDYSRVLISYGSCACVGGVYLYSRDQESRFAPVSKVVEVDYAIPGCPPSPQAVVNLLKGIEKGGGRFLDLFKAITKYTKLSGFDLIDDIVLTGLCVGCGACVLSCPTNAIQLVDGRPDLIVEKCIRCGTCVVRCPKFTNVLLQRSRLDERMKVSVGD